MQIDAGLDTGDMLLKCETEIGPEETAIELGARLARRGRRSAGRDAARARGGNDHAQPQDNDRRPRYAPILKKEDGRIDWSARARDHNRVTRARAVARGLHHLSRPARCIFGKRRCAGCGSRGAWADRREARCWWLPDEGSVELLEVQIEGRKRMCRGVPNGQQ